MYDATPRSISRASRISYATIRESAPCSRCNNRTSAPSYSQCAPNSTPPARSTNPSRKTPRYPSRVGPLLGKMPTLLCVHSCCQNTIPAPPATESTARPARHTALPDILFLPTRVRNPHTLVQSPLIQLRSPGAATNPDSPDDITPPVAPRHSTPPKSARR